MKNICVIPARLGSKRLKRKNILKINNLPVIAYSIMEAKKTGLFKHVYVATESRKIASIAGQHGAEVPVLIPKKLAGDKVPSWAPCIYIIDYLKKIKGLQFDNLVCLQPSSVLRNSADIVNGVRLFLKNKNDFLVSVTPIDPHYFHWAVSKTNKTWSMYFKNKFMKDRHLLPPVFRPNGAVKIANIAKLKETKHFFGQNLGASLMPEERSLHLISDFDLQIAKSVLSKKYA